MDDVTKIVFMVQSFDGQRFAADAFAGSIGKTLNVRMPGGVASGLLLDARVVESGRGAQLTMDIDETTVRSLGALTMKPGEYALGFTQGEGVSAVPIPAMEVREGDSQAPTDPGWLTSALRELHDEYRRDWPWQDLQADDDGVTPYGEGDGRG